MSEENVEQQAEGVKETDQGRHFVSGTFRATRSFQIWSRGEKIAALGERGDARLALLIDTAIDDALKELSDRLLNRICTLEKLCKDACERAAKYLGRSTDEIGNVVHAMEAIVEVAEADRDKANQGTSVAPFAPPTLDLRATLSVRLIAERGMSVPHAVATADALIDALENPKGFYGEPPAPLAMPPEAARYTAPRPVEEAIIEGADAEMEAILRANAARLAKGPIAPVQPLAPATENPLPFPKIEPPVDTTNMPISQRRSVYGFRQG